MPQHAVITAATCLLLVFINHTACAARPCKHPPPKSRHPSARRPPPKAATVTLTVFGDSLSDNGQNEFPRTEFSVPDPAFYDRGRCSNGPVWDELMGEVSGGTVGKVYNFAYNDAVACRENQLVMPGYPESVLPLPLDNQTDAYLAVRKNADKGAKNIVVMAIGGNDLLLIFSARNATAAGIALVQCLVDNVAKLATAGERRLAVVNLPPVQLTPYMLSKYPKGLLLLVGAAIKSLNEALKLALQGAQARFPASRIVYIDGNNLTTVIVQDAAASGVIVDVPCLTTVPPGNSPLFGAVFRNVTTVRCNSGGAGYFWYDWAHPTTVGHRALAAAFDQRLRAAQFY